MKVGILEVLSLPARHPAEIGYNLLLAKQYASVTPQAVSVWCRRLGHDTSYAVYYGVGDPTRLLPRDLDIVFISSYTQISALAYALARRYRAAGIRTVIGGPHAKAFPADCLRFFDLVVRECDSQLIEDVLRGRFDPGTLVSSARPFDDLPTVAERMPEIRASAMLWGRRRYFFTIVPMLASMGCPYACNFCVDWNNPYRLLSLDRLREDLRYLAEQLPGAPIAFHDPNFAVKFDQVLEVLEALPSASRPPYIMESSLSILRGSRLKRLKETNCVAVLPGIESWVDYSNKAAAVGKTGSEKVDQVVEHFRMLHENVPYLQGNLIFGLDSDQGDEPIRLTKDFIRRTPFVWPTINIPVPFGGTPLQADLLAAGRVLERMPFSFYAAPYLVMTLKHYDPVTYYEKLVDVMRHVASRAMLRLRVASASPRVIKMIHWSRTLRTRALIRRYEAIRERLRSDEELRRFHEGRAGSLPEFYHRLYERMLGRHAELLPRGDRTPRLDHPAPAREDGPGAPGEFGSHVLGTAAATS